MSVGKRTAGRGGGWFIMLYIIEIRVCSTKESTLQSYEKKTKDANKTCRNFTGDLFLTANLANYANATQSRMPDTGLL